MNELHRLGLGKLSDLIESEQDFLSRVEPVSKKAAPFLAIESASGEGFHKVMSGANVAAHALDGVPITRLNDVQAHEIPKSLLKGAEITEVAAGLYAVQSNHAIYQVKDGNGFVVTDTWPVEMAVAGDYVTEHGARLDEQTVVEPSLASNLVINLPQSQIDNAYEVIADGQDYANAQLHRDTVKRGFEAELTNDAGLSR